MARMISGMAEMHCRQMSELGFEVHPVSDNTNLLVIIQEQERIVHTKISSFILIFTFLQIYLGRTVTGPAEMKKVISEVLKRPIPDEPKIEEPI